MSTVLETSDPAVDATCADGQTIELQPVCEDSLSEGGEGRIELTVDGDYGIAHWFTADGASSPVVLQLNGESITFAVFDNGFSLSGGPLVNDPAIVAMLVETYLLVGRADSVVVTADLPFGDDYDTDSGRFWLYLNPDYLDKVRLE